MTLDQSILITIIIGSSILYATRWIPFEATSVLVIASIALTGLLPPEEALAGFASAATLTVGAMFVLSSGLVRTGALENVTFYLAKYSKGDVNRLLLLLAIFVPLASAFVNDTPVVVMLIPVVLSLSARFGLRSSKLLLPLAYFAIIGGTLTIFGTATNILLDDLYRSAGGPGLSVFAFTPLGIVYFLIGGAFIVLISNKLLPNRTSLAELTGNRQVATYISEIEVSDSSSLLGLSVDEVFDQIARVSQRQQPPEARQRHRRLHRRPPVALDADEASESIMIIALYRNGQAFRAEETRHLTIVSGDTLLVSGTAKSIARFIETSNTSLAPVLADGERTSASSIETRVVEAVVLPDSRLNERLIGELELNRLYNVKIMGVQHQGRQHVRGLSNIRLAGGDVLLLQGESGYLRAASDTEQLMLVEGVDDSIPRKSKNWQALLIMLAVILLASLTPIPIVVLALSGAGLMIVTKCLRADEALKALEPRALLLLAAAIPLGHAMETTGLAQAAVDFLLALPISSNPLVFLSLFYLMVNILAQFISAKAVAVLFTPIALTLAASMGVNPMSLLMVIAFATAAGFLTPMGHQVNAIVMGPGSYSFGDYIRIGLPMTILMWLAGSIFIPIIWPL